MKKWGSIIFEATHETSKDILNEVRSIWALYELNNGDYFNISYLLEQYRIDGDPCGFPNILKYLDENLPNNDEIKIIDILIHDSW